MTKDLVLENKLYRCFEMLLKEEMSINDKVSRKSFEVASKISDLIKNNNFEDREYVKDGIFKLKFSFNDEFLDRKILFTINYIHFKNKQLFDDNESKIDFSSTYTNFLGRNRVFVTLSCYGISGGVRTNEIADSIQHELNHIYQEICGSKGINNFSYDFIYNRAISRLNSKDELIKKCAWLIYFSYDFEQDGYLNGMYAYFMSDEEKLPNWDEIREMSIYKCVKTIRENLRWLKKYNITNEERGYLKKEFNISFERLLKFGERGLKRIVRKMANVLEKIKKDKGIMTLGYGLHPFIF